MTDPLTICIDAAQAGAAELDRWRGRFQVREKAQADLVTDADLAAQQAICGVLREAFPEHGIVGEESETSQRPDNEYCWIVDPLDGTTNYVHGLPHYAVSIALEKQGELLVGVILDPTAEECFSAQRGAGAKLNGEPISVSGVDRLADALVASSFPPRVEPDSEAIAQFVRVLPRSQAVRRSGSAALNLAYLAAGRYDGYWAMNVYAWDVAAGVLMLQEAGGLITGPRREPFDLWNPRLVAANCGNVHAELDQLLHPR